MKVRFGRFTFDDDTRELLADRERVHLSPKAFDLLSLLLARRPAVVTKAEFQDRLWQGVFVSDASLSVVVSEVRQALRDDSREARFVRTVHRVGYAFCGEARPFDRGTSATVADLPPRSDGSPSGACWLTQGERSFTLSPGEQIVGRDPRCHVWVDASGVSRRHARLLVSGVTVTVEDLASKNGTFVAGRRVTAPLALEDGDAIELGAARLVFRRWSDDGAPQTERIERR